MRPVRPSRPIRMLVVGGLLSGLALSSVGCSNAGEGALSGAGIGALSGLAIGSISGNAGKGALIGAGVGALGGAVIGNENKKKADAAEAQSRADEQRQQQAQQPQQAQAAQARPGGTGGTGGTAGPGGTAVVVPAAGPTVVTVTTTPGVMYETGPALSRLVGDWKFTGIIEGPDGQPVPVSGTAKASVDKTYFLRIDMKTIDSRNGNTVEGTSVISQRGGRALEMTNSFSSSPQVKQFRGEMDASGSVLSFTQFDPPCPPSAHRKIIVRDSNTREWTAEAWDGDRKLESYTFTPGGAAG